MHQLRARLPMGSLAACVLAALAGGFAHAQLTERQPELHMLVYRGYLEEDETPVTGAVDIELQLFDAATHGTPLGAAIQRDGVQVSGGHFSVELDVAPQALAHGDVWVEISISDGQPLQPRQRLVSAPRSANGNPPGTVVAFTGLEAPEGWLRCDGSVLNTAEYPALSSVLGSTFGGNGTSTFGVPDLRGRTIVAIDNLGGTPAARMSQPWASTLGGVGGAESHTLTTEQMPAHAHSLGSGTWDTSYNVDAHNRYPDMSGNGPQPSVQTGTAGGGLPHNIVQPSIALSYVIKY